MARKCAWLGKKVFKGVSLNLLSCDIFQFRSYMMKMKGMGGGDDEELSMRSSVIEVFKVEPAQSECPHCFLFIIKILLHRRLIICLV